MKNPFKSFLVFVAAILMMFFLGSCKTTSHGYNYSQHRKKGYKLSQKVQKMNKGNDLVHFKSPCKRKN